MSHELPLEMLGRGLPSGLDLDPSIFNPPLFLKGLLPESKQEIESEMPLILCGLALSVSTSLFLSFAFLCAQGEGDTPGSWELDGFC